MKEIQLDDFVERLDAKLARINERKWQRLVAWGGLLDVAGWCVVLTRLDGGMWCSQNAQRDFESRGCAVAEIDGVSGILDGIAVGTRSKGVRVWAAAVAKAAPAEALIGLTRREREVFDWLRGGKSDSEIAVILGCAARTVEKHVANLYRKLGVGSRAAAILHPADIRA